MAGSEKAPAWTKRDEVLTGTVVVTVVDGAAMLAAAAVGESVTMPVVALVALVALAVALGLAVLGAAPAAAPTAGRPRRPGGRVPPGPLDAPSWCPPSRGALAGPVEAGLESLKRASKNYS